MFIDYAKSHAVSAPRFGVPSTPRSWMEVTMKALSGIGFTVRKRLMADDGLTTAEYAVGTVAVAVLGGLFFKLLTSDGVRDLIWTLFRSAFSSILG